MSRAKRIAVIVLFVLISTVCAGGCFYTTRMLDSQYEYLRWQGGGDLAFSQISCFFPADDKKTIRDIYGFRTDMIRAFSDADIDTSDGNRFIDCWSCSGSAKVYGERNDVTSSVLAVGGQYFTFHPLQLVNGSYFSEDDLMRDNILLDEDLAWLLFGGNDLEGLTVHIFSMPFRIAGVVSRDDDFASRKAYTSGLGLYMSYDAYLDLSGDETAGITCYEVCIPNPVKGYALQLAKDKFPVGSGEILENSGRFGFWKLLGYAKNFASRAMHSGPSYPYWENAARYAESMASLLLLLALLSAILPLFVFLSFLFREMRQAKETLREEVLPGLGESAQEAIRVRQRKRWEKKHDYKAKH